jgi:hypothetical protein
MSETEISLFRGGETAGESVSTSRELLSPLGVVGVPHEVHQSHG